MNKSSTIDYVIFITYFLVVSGYGYWVYTRKKKEGISLAGPKINQKAFAIDRAMFKVAPSTLALIVITLLLLTALYVKFW